MRRIPSSFYQGAMILAPGAICIGINLGLVASLTDNPVIGNVAILLTGMIQCALIGFFFGDRPP